MSANLMITGIDQPSCRAKECDNPATRFISVDYPREAMTKGIGHYCDSHRPADWVLEKLGAQWTGGDQT